MLESKLLQSMKDYDIQLFCCCTCYRSQPTLFKLSRAASHTGDGYYYLLVPILLYYSQLDVPRNFYLCLFAGFTLERLLYYLLKQGFKRNRPAESIEGYQSLIKPSDQFSFPSGHTSAAFLFSTLLASLFPAAAIALFIWAACVGVSRFFLGVHFATDVLMGALIGVSVGTICLSWLT